MPVFTVKRTETYYVTVEAPSRKALDAAISGEDAQRHEWLHARLDKGYEDAHNARLAALAPEMAEALRAILANGLPSEATPGVFLADARDVEAARAILTKLEG